MAKPELDETGMNASGTCAGASTKEAHSVRYELIDKNGMSSFGSFATATDAVLYAQRLWPDQEQDPKRTGRGWDIQVAGAE